MKTPSPAPGASPSTSNTTTDNQTPPSGISCDLTLYPTPVALNRIYRNHLTSYQVFLLLRPNRMTMSAAFAHSAKMIPMSGETVTEPVSEDDNHPANDFALIDQTGKPFHLSQLRGKVVLLFFGYTHCPDACPTTMAKLAQVYKLLGSDGQEVVTLFASVDPGRDTPSALKGYLAYFRVNSIGLTGTKEEIDAVVKQYGAKYEIEQSDSAAGYHVNHSTDLYLLDKRGELAKTFSYSAGTQVIVNGVREAAR